LFSILLAQFLLPPLTSLPKDRTLMTFKHASQMGISICEERLTDLLELRMEDSPEMNATAKEEALEEAVEYLKTHQVDLLLLDMIMDPGTDGLETHKKILELHPEQRAMIVSGFSETGRMEKVQELGAGAYVRKPFLLKKIGLTVKAELKKQRFPIATP
jgi:DNA-binding NarL/FixJ family response regulator